MLCQLSETFFTPNIIPVTCVEHISLNTSPSKYYIGCLTSRFTHKKAKMKKKLKVFHAWTTCLKGLYIISS